MNVRRRPSTPGATPLAGALLAGALLVGCLTPRDPVEAPTLTYEGPTEITALEWSCSASGDTWTIAVETVGWTSGGLLSWSADGAYVEEHDLRSTSAAADGSSDAMSLDLTIEADPSDFTRGASTALLCDEPTLAALSGRLAVYDPDGDGEADCVAWGDVDWGTDFGYGACGVWEIEATEDTGDAGS